jgi:hypothetical protein
LARSVPTQLRRDWSSPGRAKTYAFQETPNGALEVHQRKHEGGNKGEDSFG